MLLSLFTVIAVIFFSVSDKNEAGEVSVRVSRVSTYIPQRQIGLGDISNAIFMRI